MGSSQRNNQFNDEDRAEKEPLISDESFREKYRDILGDDDSEPEITHKWKSRKKKSFVEEVNIKQLILLIIVLIAVILAAVFGIRSCVRAVGNGKTGIEGSIASASEATVSEAETGQVIQVPMKYTIDRDAKTVTSEKDLQAIRKAAEESEGSLTQESMETAAESLDDSFDYSVDQDTLTLSEREYGDQIILIKQ